MHYLFETEHFLLRKRTSEDVLHFAELFSEGNMIPFVLRQGFVPGENTPEALSVEFRTTGALAGEVVVRNSTEGRDNAEILCRLCREFQGNRFKTEIADAVNLIL